MPKQTANNIPALSRLFSSAVFCEMAKKGKSALFRRLIDQTDITDECDADATVGSAFDRAFKILKRSGNRNEYIYRAAITEKILLGTHTLSTSTMLNEFRVGSCKADLVILNGTATVYEIKSERDTLSRLANQIENYKKVFPTINVIASECHIKNVMETIPDDVGVMCLSKQYQISTKREAKDCPDRICPLTAFESLRTAEAAIILESLGITVPQVPNMLRRAALQNLFKNLNPKELHTQMVTTLKETRTLKPLSSMVNQLPQSLRAAALSIRMRRMDHNSLSSAIATPLSATATWNK